MLKGSVFITYPIDMKFFRKNEKLIIILDIDEIIISSVPDFFSAS